MNVLTLPKRCVVVTGLLFVVHSDRLLGFLEHLVARNGELHSILRVEKSVGVLLTCRCSESLESLSGFLQISHQPSQPISKSKLKIAMLRRKPTRLELKAEDKEEYDEAKRRAAAAARAASTAGPAASALLDHQPKPSVNQRIGLYK